MKQEPIGLPKDLSEVAKEVQKLVGTYAPYDCSCEVKYRLYQEGDEVVWSNDACFSQLVKSFCRNKSYDPGVKLSFNFSPPKIVKESINKKVVPWISLLQKMNILTDYRSAEEIAATGLTIEIDKKLSPFDFYLQVSMIRHMREEPAFVEKVLELVQAGADFWAAVFFCHIGGLLNNSGHSLVPNPPYGGVKYGSVRMPMSMSRQHLGHGKVDSRSLLTILETGRKGARKVGDYYSATEVPWQIHQNVDKLGFNCQLVVDPPWYLLDPRIYPLYRVSSTEELSEVLQHVKEEHGIVFK